MGNCLKPKKSDENPEDNPEEDQSGAQGENGIGSESQDVSQSRTSAARHSVASVTQQLEDADAGRKSESIWVSNPNIGDSTTIQEENETEGGPRASKTSVTKDAPRVSSASVTRGSASSARKTSRLSFGPSNGPNRSSLGSFSGRSTRTSRNSSISSKRTSAVGSAVRSGSIQPNMNVDCSSILKRTSNAVPSTSTYLECYNRNKSTVSGDITCSDIQRAMACENWKKNYDVCNQPQRTSYSGCNNGAGSCCHGYNPELSSVQGAARFSVVPRSDTAGCPQGANGRFSRTSTTDSNQRASLTDSNHRSSFTDSNHNNRESRDKKTKGKSGIRPNTDASGRTTETDTPREGTHESNCDVTLEMRSQSAYILDCQE